MDEKQKCLQYYIKANSNSYFQIQEIKDKVKEDFPDKEIEFKIQKNNFGVYILTFYFKTKNTFLSNVILDNKPKKLFIKNKYEKEKTRLEKYYGENRYGKYKPTKTYKPY